MAPMSEGINRGSRTPTDFSWPIGAVLALLLVSLPAPAAATPPAGCGADQGFPALDFWVGTWRVTEKGEFAGTDVVSKILGGCAVTEEWSDAGGGKGESFFYYDPFFAQWTQVWVTDRATQRGGLKIKRLVARFADKGTRFEGVLPGPPGSTIVLDRTTLRPIDRTHVHQVIEISRDGGTTWRTTFDALYTRTR